MSGGVIMTLEDEEVIYGRPMLARRRFDSEGAAWQYAAALATMPGVALVSSFFSIQFLQHVVTALGDR